MRLDCGRCVLRPWREGDEPSLVRHGNNYEVWRSLRDRFPRPYTRADAGWWIAFARRQDPQTHLAIEVDGEAAGGIGLELKSDVERRSAEIGYWLGQAFWGRGIVTAAVRSLTVYGFEAFDLTRIFAVPFANSHASIRVLEKCGYVLEGTMRRSAIKEGVVLDQVLYAVTDRDLARTQFVTSSGSATTRGRPRGRTPTNPSGPPIEGPRDPNHRTSHPLSSSGGRA